MHLADPRNDKVLVYVSDQRSLDQGGGPLVPRSSATVSVFDAGFVVGDGVWESFRLVGGRVAFAADHFRRLFESARAIDLTIGRTADELLAAILQTCAANDMKESAHIRLMVTRGTKSTPNQDPRNVSGVATVVIIAEHKVPDPKLEALGIRLFTSAFRCAQADVFDMRINSHSRLNLIYALQQAVAAGADEALMLDPSGFVASCNSTNFFIVKDEALRTSTGRFNFKGITRQKVLAIARAEGIPTEEADFTIFDAYNADEAFVTGTLGGLTPVVTIDGRPVGSTIPGALTRRLSDLYAALLRAEGPPP